MDDSQRQPRDGDRTPVRDRIRRSVANGRISAADGDIRLTNVSSAHSMAELDLIVRDLDQLESMIQPGAFATAPEQVVATPAPTATIATATGAAGDGIKRTLPVLVAVLALLLAGAGAVGYFVIGDAGGSGSVASESPRDLPSALPIDPEDPVPGPDQPGAPGPGSPGAPETRPASPGAAYALTATGIRDFLATYRKQFSTTKVVELTLYDDYVIARVPVPGKARFAGWIYRNGQFSDFGGVSANFPGSDSVDTRRLDVAALMKNIGKARRTLDVEDYSTTYVTLNYRPQFDEAPNVNIYVANEFGESGYLATFLDGRVERSFPYSS